MKHIYTRGASSLLIVFIVVILGVVAYSIFKNRNLPQPETTITEEVSLEQNTQTENTYRKQENTNVEANQKTTTELSSQDISTIEQETNAVDIEIQNLLLEDLAVE